MELRVRVGRGIAPALLLIPDRRPVRDQTATGDVGSSLWSPARNQPVGQEGKSHYSSPDVS